MISGRIAMVACLCLLASALGLLAPPVAAGGVEDASLGIAGDAELLVKAEEEGWPGTGTAEDPLRITGLEIRTDGHGVWIQDTTLHWILSESTVISTGPSSNGIHLRDVRNGEVSENQAEAGHGAISVYGSRDIVVADNVISRGGLHVSSGERVTVVGNEVVDSNQAFRTTWMREMVVRENSFTGTYGETMYLSVPRDSTFEGNTVTGGDTGIYIRAGVWGTRLVGNTVSEAERCIHVDAAPMHVVDNEVHSCERGIFVDHPSNILEGNHVHSNTEAGIDVAFVTNEIQGNHVEDNGPVGIVVRDLVAPSSRGDGVVIADNHVSHHETGISLDGTTQATQVFGNKVIDNTVGLLLAGSLEPTLRTNTITANAVGLRLEGTQDALVYDNRFDNEELNAELVGSNPGVTWNVHPQLGPNILGGDYLGGNWWHDHIGVDADLDGLGDTPYGPLEEGRVPVPLEPIYREIFAYGPFDRAPLMAPLPVQVADLSPQPG